MRVFENCVFDEAVVVNEDAKFSNCEFKSGSVAKQQGVFGLSVAGAADVEVKNCKFANKGYSAVYLNTTGKVDIVDNEFEGAGLYNPIEGASSEGQAQLTEVNVKGNTFKGICGNNYINLYQMAEGGVANIEKNTVLGMSQQAEVIRLSNLTNHSATFNVKDTVYTYDMSTAYHDHWTTMFLCQDYTKDGIQDFRKYTINVQGVNCNGVKVVDKDNFPVGHLICIYDPNKSFDGENIYADGNMPVINFQA